MTGFARCEARGAYGALVWEARSVNHRYLETFFRLPEELRLLEGDCRALATTKIKRGKLDCVLRFEPQAAGHTDEQHDERQSLRLNTGLARQLIRLCHELDSLDSGDHAAPPPRIDAMRLLQWPGVVRQPALDLESVATAALELLGVALDELAAMRGNEGERIKGLLLQRCADIEAIVAAIRAHRPRVIMGLRTRLDQRLREIIEKPNQERLEQELVLQAQRMDIDEELDRLQSHVAETRATLERDRPAGRRLDFLMQEFHREANTISAKAADLETTKSAVELKVLIEQMREQAQNVG